MDLNKKKLIDMLAKLTVSCYGKIWALDHNKLSNSKQILRGFGWGLLSPAAGIAAMISGGLNDLERIEKRETVLNLEIKQTMLNIMRLSHMIYPNNNVAEATLLALTDTNLAHGEERIYDENVAKGLSNGYGGEVLVSEACNKVISLINNYERSYKEEIQNRPSK